MRHHMCAKWLGTTTEADIRYVLFISMTMNAWYNIKKFNSLGPSDAYIN